MHQLWINRQGEQTEITGLVGGLSWQSHISTLGVQVNFSLAYSDATYFPRNTAQVGDILHLKNNGAELFRGIVTSETRSGRSARSYTAFDFAFYLNKSKGVYQFNYTAADTAIRELLADFQVPIGKITAIPTLIDCIYKDKAISEIIKDILQQASDETGRLFRLEMRPDGLYIEDQEDLIVEAQVRLAENLPEFEATEAISEPSRSFSITDMRNSIQIVSDGDLGVVVVAQVRDEANIQRYGLLQEVLSVDDKDIAQAQHIAAHKLAELNRITESNRLLLLGHDAIRAGRLLRIKEPVTGMSGLYLVQSCTHTARGGLHQMNVELKGVSA